MTGRDDGSLRVTRSLSIPLDEIEVRASTSGGPGGQHANRSQTRVDVSFDVVASAALGPRQRARLLERAGPVVRAGAADTRSQTRNRELALERLQQKMAAALHVEPARRPTRPSASARAERVEDKRRRGDRKLQRRRPSLDD
jgi:ribosome-associated protein